MYVCSVSWGCSVPWGYHEDRGGYLEYRGQCSAPWGDMIHVGGYHEYRGRCSVPWGDIIFCYLSTVGDIMIHVEEYHEYRSGVKYRGGIQITKDDIPHGTEHPP